MSVLKNRRDGEITTSSDLEEDEISEEREYQDETSDETSDSEKLQLIKFPNGFANHSQSYCDNQDLTGGEKTTNGLLRNGSVVIPIPDLQSGDSSSFVKGATDVYRYHIKESFKVDERKQRLKPYPRELTKVCVAALFTFCNFVATATSLSIVHEYYPVTEPLPDHILDSLPYEKWALKFCEILLSMHTALAIVVIIFHKHSFIVIRRVFLILGLLYGYRAITMFVTVLPRADSTYYCSPKMSEQGQALTFFVIAERVFSILSGFGLTINGKHTFCGDYIFSGHTMMFVLTFLVIREYTTSRFFLVHWLLWASAIAGISLLLLSRGHYTIDCIIAYYITTRLWYMYHTMACHASLKKPSRTNYLSRIWWWNIFRWFEENVRPGPIPNGFSVPLSRKICKCLQSKSRELVNETSRLTRIKRGKIPKQAA